jgi:hypothetical protein
LIPRLEHRRREHVYSVVLTEEQPWTGTEWKESEADAKKAAKELLGNYPMLKVEIYNASAKARTLFKQ